MKDVRVLVVDDDPDVLSVVIRALERDGHHVRGAGCLATARNSIADSPPDILVLDMGLPDGTGVDFCRELRSTGDYARILFLTARQEVSQRVEGLEAGGDDYLSKPFAVAELRARVRALGRRAPEMATWSVCIGDTVLELGLKRASRSGQEVSLTAREWAILETLALQKRVVGPDELLERIWGESTPENRASLDVLMARIRRKLSPEVVRTLRGQGYTLASPP